MHGMIIVSFLTAKLYHYDADCAIKSTLCIIAYFSLFLKHYFYDERRFYVFFKITCKTISFKYCFAVSELYSTAERFSFARFNISAVSVKVSLKEPSGGLSDGL